MRSIKDLYNKKYGNESWKAIQLRPHATHTNAYDDTFRLLRKTIPSGSILEVGCGSGRLAVALAEKGYDVLGYDLSDVRIELATKVVQENYPHLASKLNFVAGDVDDLIPGQKNGFDCVILCAVLEHVPDPFVLLRQCYERTGHNGHIIVSVPNAGYIKHIFSLLRGRVPKTGTPNRDMEYWEEHGWDGAHFHYFTKIELKNALKHVGYAPIEWTSDGKFAKFRRWSTLLSGELTVVAQKTS